MSDALSPLTFEVNFVRSGKRVTCASDQTILDAARLAGLRLPFSCTKGMCGTCKTRLTSGTVEMGHNGGIRQQEIDKGMILICCSKPLTALTIDR